MPRKTPPASTFARRPPSKAPGSYANAGVASPHLAGIKKIHPEFLPIISATSGNSINQIRDALTTYCQRELGGISKIFASGEFEPPKEILYRAEDYSETADPHGINKGRLLNRMRVRDSEIDQYNNSKLRLFGIITSMMTKELDEKMKSYFADLQKREAAAASSTAAATTTIDPSCPLLLWKSIVIVLTSKTSGNIRIDQDAAAYNFSSAKQKPNESIHEFQLRLENIISTYTILDLTPPSKESQAMRFIQGLENSRFSTMQTHFANELNLGRDLYPIDLSSAAGQASRWMVVGSRGPQDVQTSFMGIKKNDKKTKDKDSKDKHKEAPKKTYNPKTETKKCIYCNNLGHTILECNKLKAAQATAQDTPKNTANKSKPPAPREGTTMMPHLRQETDDEEDFDTHFMIAHVHLVQSCSNILATGGAGSITPTQIVLDTGANASVVKNKKLLQRVHRTRTVHFDGLAGILPISEIGDLEDLCSAYYSPHAIANIVSFSQLRENGHAITYNSGYGRNPDTFTVRTPLDLYTFSRRTNGLYVCDISHHRTVAVTTVADNEALFTRAEVIKAKQARNLMQRMGHPPDAKMIRALQYGNLHGTSILPADIHRATTIYGPSVAALRGRTNTQRPHAFPAEQPRDRAVDPQSMYLDLFRAHSMDFLLTYVRPLNHLMVTAIAKSDLTTLRRTLRTHLGVYGQRRIRIQNLYCDGEKGITAMAADFAGAGITLYQSGPGMHVHVIERQIQTVKKGVRTGLACLPYSCCNLIFKFLVGFTVTRENMFPDSTRTDNLSPFQILYNRPVDVNRDAHLEFGALYEVTSRTGDNTMAFRTITSIGLAQTPNGTGTCQFFNIGAGTIFSANHFKQVPMTADIISRLNALAALDKHAPTKDPIFTYHGNEVLDSSTDLEPAIRPYVRADPDPGSSQYVRSSPNVGTTVTPYVHPTPQPETTIRPYVRSEVPHPGNADSQHFQLITDLPPDPLTMAPSGAPIRADSLHMPSHTEESRGDPELPIVTSPTVEEPEPDDMPALIEGDDDEDDDFDRTLTRQPTSTPYSHPKRDRRPPDRLNLHITAPTLLSAFHITARRALKENREQAEPAIMAELATLLTKKVFHAVDIQSLTPQQQKGILNSTMNVTQKFAPSSDGKGRIKDKLKARLVGGGNRQDRTMYTREETSSPTVSTTSVLLLCQLAAAERRTVTTLDIGSAYLNAAMPKDDPLRAVHMRISPEIATFLIKLDPEMAKFQLKNGSIIVELDQALYGCIESAVLWYQELSSTMDTLGYKANPLDPCVFNSVRAHVQTTVAVYVDDLLITGNDAISMSMLIDGLKKKYKELKVVTGKVHNYLGMVLDFTTDDYVSVSQAGMTLDITRDKPLDAVTPHKDGHANSTKTPAPTYLFDVTSTSDSLDSTRQKIIHSVGAKILFLGTHSRPDIITANSFHTKRVLAPTDEDARKLKRTLSYLEATASLPLILGCNLPPAVHTFIDASFAVHPNMRSHSGTCTTLGTGMFHCKSTMQKTNATSSCHSELIALSKGLNQSLWICSFLEAQGYPRMPVTVYQDNLSTIKLVENGRSNSELTRHIAIGYFWVHDLIKRDLIMLKYCSTDNMIADYFTKPLQGSLFIKLRDLIMGKVATIEKK